METLHAEIDQLESSIAKLTEDITDLTKADLGLSLVDTSFYWLMKGDLHRNIMV